MQQTGYGPVAYSSVPPALFDHDFSADSNSSRTGLRWAGLVVGGGEGRLSLGSPPPVTERTKVVSEC